MRANDCVTHLILDMGFGGAETLAHDIAVSLHAKDLRTNIVCLDSITRDPAALAGQGIPVELVRRGKGSFDFRTFARLVQRLKKLGTTLIHAHDMSSLDYAVAAGFVLGLPVVMTEHSRHYIEERGLRRLEKRALCHGVSALVEVSGALAKASRQDGVSPEKITVIENGVDVERFSLADRGMLRRELGVGADGVLVGMVGRLETIKGPQTLLTAFSGSVPVCRDTASSCVFHASHGPHESIPGAKNLLSKASDKLTRCRQTHLVFAGDGSLRGGLERRAQALGIKERVHFLGSRADIPEIMAGLDILALPSLSEGLPFALLEGMAAGRAVVASSVGAIPDILGGVRGVLVQPANSEMLADALVTLIRDPAVRASIGVAAKAHVERHYNKQTMLERYLAVYDRALAAKRGCRVWSR